MSATGKEDNKTLVRRLFDAILSQGRVELLDELIAPAYVENNPVPGQKPGAEGVKARLKTLRGAFPDIRFVLESLVAEGALVAARYHWEGTHKGTFLGIPPTGRKVVVRGMDFYRFAEGRIVEHWDNVDEFGMLSQLGDLG